MTNLSDVSMIGVAIRKARQAQHLTQPDLALIADVGIRFIVDIESGKETCQIGKVLQVMNALGVRLDISSTTSPGSQPYSIADSNIQTDDDDPPAGPHL